jgi:hypothetical protein
MNKSEKQNKDFICRERQIDSYEINWRLILATQLMGESQVRGSIIGLMLDLTRDTFSSNWTPMEEAIGLEQI